MAQRKTNTLSIGEIRDVLGFNKKLIRVNYDRNTGCIDFQFWDDCARTKIGFFEMSEHDCDYGAFDEFAYCCIDNFDSENLSDNEIIERSKQVYLSVIKIFQKRAMARFLTDSHNQIDKKIMEVKADSLLFMPRFSQLQRISFQPETF